MAMTMASKCLVTNTMGAQIGNFGVESEGNGGVGAGLIRDRTNLFNKSRIGRSGWAHAVFQAGR